MAKKLNAWIRKNPLTSDPNDYVAVPVTVGSIQIGGIVDELEKEGMELKRETVIDVVNRFNRKAAEMLVSGYNVNTGLVYMRPIIKGVFYGKTWNSQTHSLVASITPGMDLREAIGETNVEILGEQSNPLEILSLTDTFTSKTDGTLTKGRNAEIKGSYLKIAGEDPACGVAFTNIATGEVTRLDMADLVINEPSRLLIFVSASLVAGEYELSLTTQFSTGSTLLKQPRSTTFGVPVVIA